MFFADTFIGTGSYTNECIIGNKETLRFRYSKKKHLLTVQLSKEGFEVKRLIKTSNYEKERVKKILSGSSVLSSLTTNWKSGTPIDINVKQNDTKGSLDSSGYYDRILRQPDEIETYGNYYMPLDIVSYGYWG
jgi:hypothetical protein